MEGRPLDDAELIARAQSGNVAAYEDLIQRYQEVAFRTAYHITHDAGEAEDATQEAFVKAYAALGRFRAGAPFRPWLLRIVAREALDRRQAAVRRSGLTLRAAEAQAAGAPAQSPEATAEAHEERATLIGALNQLRPEDRLVLAYRYFLDLSEAEMAEALGCRPGTVKSRLSRIMRRLREQIK